MILQVTGQFPLLNWFCSQFSAHIKQDVVTHCSSSLRFLTQTDSSAWIRCFCWLCLLALHGCTVFRGPGAARLESRTLLLDLPACIPPSFRRLWHVCQIRMNTGTKTLLLSQPLTNNLTTYKLFKSNEARVLRTSSCVLLSVAMTIFGPIFPHFWALHWIFLLFPPHQMYTCLP